MSSRFILITACYQLLLLLLLSCLWPHGLQHIRLSCPSPSLWTCSNSCSLSLWCHPTISSSVIPFTCPQSFPASGTFLMNRLCIRWPKYWSFNFSISPSNEYSGLVSFRIDWFHLLAVIGTLMSLLQHHDLPASVGRSTQDDGSQWRVLTKCDPLEEGMAKHSSILASGTLCTAWKGRKAIECIINLSTLSEVSNLFP